jgi:hypothetical protein
LAGASKLTAEQELPVNLNKVQAQGQCLTNSRFPIEGHLQRHHRPFPSSQPSIDSFPVLSLPPSFLPPSQSPLHRFESDHEHTCRQDRTGQYSTVPYSTTPTTVHLYSSACPDGETHPLTNLLFILPSFLPMISSMVDRVGPIILSLTTDCLD